MSKMRFPWMRRWLVAGLCAVVLASGGCAATRQVNRAELDRAMTRHSGSTINHMFYMGTRRGEHYLRHQTAGGVMVYRVPEEELRIEPTFTHTRDPDRWRLVAQRWWPVGLEGFDLDAPEGVGGVAEAIRVDTPREAD